MSLSTYFYNEVNNFKNLLIVLALFVIMQGIYHSTGALGFSLLAKGILAPLSFGFVCSFFTLIARGEKNEEKIKMT